MQELHIAVVCRGADQPTSGGTNGAWSAFLGTDEDHIRSARNRPFTAHHSFAAMNAPTIAKAIKRHSCQGLILGLMKF
jgi:hypothetical protein